MTYNFETFLKTWKNLNMLDLHFSYMLQKSQALIFEDFALLNSIVSFSSARGRGYRGLKNDDILINPSKSRDSNVLNSLVHS